MTDVTTTDWKALSIIPLTLLFFSVLLMTGQQPTSPAPSPAPVIPEFSAITDVKVKKQTFFDFMLPMVRAANNQVWIERQKLLALQDQANSEAPLSDADAALLTELAGRYRVKKDTLSTTETINQLLVKVDTIPASLVLAQSANESGWGTARFARNGNNFFGIWCFSADCGLVPKQRDEGAKHEVARFSSVQAGVHYYVRLLNSHPAYDPLREIRAELRVQGQAVSGRALAEGLLNYSERREAYVEELRAMIRVNRLSQYTLARSQSETGSG